MMTAQSARAKADAMLDAWNRRDYDGVASHLTSDVILVDHTRGRTSTGPDAYVTRFRRLLDASPNMQCESVSVLVDGGLLVQETIWRGRHTAPLVLPGYINIVPTNELIAQHFVTYMEFDDEGKVKALRTYGDPAEVPLLTVRPVGVG